MSLWERLALTISMSCVAFAVGWLLLVMGILKHTTMFDIAYGTAMFGIGYFLALEWAKDRETSP